MNFFMKRAAKHISAQTITSLIVFIVGLIVNLVSTPLFNVAKNAVINSDSYKKSTDKQKEHYNVALGITEDDIIENRMDNYHYTNIEENNDNNTQEEEQENNTNDIWY